MLSIIRNCGNYNSNIWSILLLFCVFALSGCGSKLTVNNELNKQFSSPVNISEDESLVYVIRQSSMLGAARGLYVALDDKIVGNVNSGTYCYFRTKNDINTVNLEQVVPFGYTRIDNRKGEEIFLYFEMSTGKFTELEKELGMTAVMKSSLAKDIVGGSKNNNGFISGLINPNLVGLNLMKETDEQLVPDGDNSVITFIRAQSFITDMAFGIWDEQGFLGNLKGQSYFQIKVPAGKYNFFGKSEHFSVLEANITGGKHYFVQVAANMGWSQPHIKLLPVNGETEQKDLDKWVNGSKKVKLDDAAIDETIKKRLDLALPHIEEALTKVKNGQLESRKLTADDGRQI